MNHTLSLFASGCCALALAGPPVHAAKPIADFKASESEKFDWRIVNDGVMGGLSKGAIEVSDEDILTFSGNLSLENNGGFSSFRSGGVEMDLGSFDGLVTRVKGDGRTYQVRLYTEERYRGGRVSFSADFKTKKDTWAEVKVPFSDFKASWRGRSLPDRKFNPAEIRGLGMLLADKKAGPFKLQVDWLRAYGENNAKGETIVDLAVADGRFETLAAALEAAGLVDALKGNGPFTVFAPTDEAFAKLPKETVASLLKPANKGKLQAVLKYHVVSGSIGLSDALKAGEAGTLEGNPLTIGFSNGRVKVGDSVILDADIAASNGVIHVIDSVLLPASKGDRAPKGQSEKKSPDAPSPTTRIEDAIDRGVPVFNKGDHAACAEIYRGCLAALAKDERVDSNLRQAVTMLLERTSDHSDATDLAWVYRKGLDHLYMAMQPKQG